MKAASDKLLELVAKDVETVAAGNFSASNVLALSADTREFLSVSSQVALTLNKQILDAKIKHIDTKFSTAITEVDSVANKPPMNDHVRILSTAAQWASFVYARTNDKFYEKMATARSEAAEEVLRTSENTPLLKRLLEQDGLGVQRRPRSPSISSSATTADTIPLSSYEGHSLRTMLNLLNISEDSSRKDNYPTTFAGIAKVVAEDDDLLSREYAKAFVTLCVTAAIGSRSMLDAFTDRVSSIIRSKPEYSVFGRVNLTRLSFIGHIIIREAPPIQEYEDIRTWLGGRSAWESRSFKRLSSLKKDKVREMIGNNPLDPLRSKQIYKTITQTLNPDSLD